MKKEPKYLHLLLTAAFICMMGMAFAQQQTDEQLGMQYYSTRQYDKAAEVFSRLYDKSPTLFSYIYYVNCLFELKDFDKAEKLIKKQKRLNQNDVRFDVDLGYLYILQEQTQKGRKTYDECLKNLKPDRNAINNLASAFFTRRETDYGIKTYLKGRDLLNEKSAFAFELAIQYEIQGNSADMLNEYFILIAEKPEQLATVQNRMQAWLADDPDNSKNDLFRSALLKKSQQEPDEVTYAELLLWYSVQQKDFELALIQAKALDRRYGEDGQRVYDLARLSYTNDDFDVTIDAYNYIIKKNADSDLVLKSRIELLNTEFAKALHTFTYDGKFLDALEQRYISLLNESGKSQATIPLIRNLGHLQAFYLNKTDSAIALLESAVALPGIPAKLQADCKLELADIYLFSDDPWEATLLYSQVEKSFKNEPVGHEAKFRNAKLSFYIGEFEWAKTQLDILKAATSKLIANDAMQLSLLISDNMDEDSTYGALSMYARAEMFEFRNKDAEALVMLDSLNAKYPYSTLSDEVLFKKAAISMKNKQFEDAASYYRKIVSDFPTDLLADDALFALASLFENQLNDKDKAMELYQTLMTSFPGSLFVVEARKHYRTLRNDPLNL
ncbi:MAG TPA: tetratricopeptide repeat protein [Bacteroidales bacterium]|nr:tetratricopeptide repeat protein [Bacteroidales bacterium]